MSTKHEIDARIAESQDRMHRHIDRMNERLTHMTARIKDRVGEEFLANRFNEGEKVDQYNWNYEYSFQPGRRCFASNNLILPGTKVYKGTFALGRINNNSPGMSMPYPAEIWITKEEFTVRRLKDQI